MDSDWCNHKQQIRDSYYQKKADKRTDRLDKINGTGWGHADRYVRPSRIRCNECGRLLTPKVINTEEYLHGGDFILVLPKHKKKFHDRPSNKKARKKKEGRGYNVRGK